MWNEKQLGALLIIFELSIKHYEFKEQMYTKLHTQLLATFTFSGLSGSRHEGQVGFKKVSISEIDLVIDNCKYFS